jgi:predicted MFS family arabinose efflux permease
VRQVLKLPAYRRLLTAYTFNELAWTVGSLALVLLVYRRTGSAIGAMGFYLCSQFVPALFSPAIVARLDQRAAGRILPALYTLEGLLFMALAWLATRFSLVPVLTLALADGIVALSARSLARTATVAVTSPAGLLREGNALTNGAFSICYMAGPALGGLIVEAGGTSAALLTNSGLFALIAVTLATAASLPGAAGERAPVAGRLRAALSYVRTQPGIRALLVLQAGALVFFTISIPVEVVFVQHSLRAGAGGLGALLSAWGAGVVAGSVIYARWRRLPGRALITLGAGALGIGFIAMALAPSLMVAVIGAAAGGAGNGIEAIAAHTELQEQTEQRWMALTMSLNESVTQAAPGVGIVIGGIIAALAGPRIALAAAGIGALMVTVAAWIVLRPGTAGLDARKSPDGGAAHEPADGGEGKGAASTAGVSGRR